MVFFLFGAETEPEMKKALDLLELSTTRNTDDNDIVARSQERLACSVALSAKDIYLFGKVRAQL